MSRLHAVPRRIVHELGVLHILHAARDVHLLLVFRFLRMIAFGAGTLVLALYFSALGYTDASIGLFMTVLLLCDAPRSLFFSIAADGLLGRRRTLFIMSLGMAATGVVFALADQYWLLLLAAVLGIMPAGKDAGPFRAVEESTIAHLTEKEGRTFIYAWYYVLVAMGTAVGLFGAGALVQRLQHDGHHDTDAYRAVYWLFTGIGIAKMLIVLLLSKQCELHDEDAATSQVEQEPRETDETAPLLRETSQSDDAPSNSVPDPQPKKKSSSRPSFASRLSTLSPPSVVVLIKLCILYILDAIGLGMANNALLNYYVDRTFRLPKAKLGFIMSMTQVASAVTTMASPGIAVRIGMVPAMICTHLPAAVSLALIPVPRDIAWVIVLVMLRHCLNSMQQAPRSTFLSSIIRNDERTTVMGVLNVVKTLAQSVGPYITGFLAGREYFWVAFIIAGSLRAGYDVGLVAFFVIPKYRQKMRKNHWIEGVLAATVAA